MYYHIKTSPTWQEKFCQVFCFFQNQIFLLFHNINSHSAEGP
nr:MAG TPA: hypothetical protein [Caudoviricetes sp.]